MKLFRIVDAKGKTGWTSAVTKNTVKKEKRKKVPKMDRTSAAARVDLELILLFLQTL